MTRKQLVFATIAGLTLVAAYACIALSYVVADENFNTTHAKVITLAGMTTWVIGPTCVYLTLPKNEGFAAGIIFAVATGVTLISLSRHQLPSSTHIIISTGLVWTFVSVAFFLLRHMSSEENRRVND